jgi:protein CpxP
MMPPSDAYLITHWRCTMKKIYAVAAGVVAGVALAVAAVTHAQPFGGMGPGFAHGMGPGHGPMGNVDPSTMADTRLADLKAQLTITPAQESAWQAFADAAKQQASGMQGLRAQMQAGSATAPERMAQRASAMQQRAAGMTTMTKAFDALYGVLTPEQKTIADQHFGTMGPRAMRFGPRAG